MTWLITGGCGFLGTALIKRLRADGFSDLRIVDNLQVGTRRDLSLVTEYSEVTAVQGPPRGVELLIGDIRDEALALQASQGCEIVAHLAANTGVGPSVENPRADCLVNVIGTFNYLEASRLNGVKRFIFASSGAPAGEVEPPIHEELPPHPVSPYGASKLAGEGYCSAYYRSFGLETVALRFGNVYGPGSVHKASVVAKFIMRAMRGDPLEIFGDGRQTRDFIYIDDLIEAIILASRAPDIGGETFQIATGRETTVGEMAQQLSEALTECGVKGIHILNTQPRRGDVLRNYSDTTKARARLGWRASKTLAQGLRSTISYFLENRSS